MTNPRVHFVNAGVLDENNEPLEAGWYFWDEILTIRNGPFDTDEEAERECEIYYDRLEE